MKNKQGTLRIVFIILAFILISCFCILVFREYYYQKFIKAIKESDYSLIEKMLANGYNSDTIFVRYRSDKPIDILKFNVMGDTDLVTDGELFENRYTGLSYAVENNDPALAKIFLDYHASLNSNATTINISDFACRFVYKDKTMTTLLFKHGANFNSSPWSKIMLQQAKYSHDDKMVKYLNSIGITN